jgi:hypothetical protein
MPYTLGIMHCPGLQQGQQENFVSNVAGSLSGATSQVRQQTYCKFSLGVCGTFAATDNENSCFWAN